MVASDEGRKVTLKSSDGKEFLVEETVAMESQTIRNMIEDGCADSGIPLPNVNSKILSKVIEYCKKHVESAAKPSVAAGGDEKAAEEDLKGWNSDFVKVDQATLFELILHKLSVTAVNTNTEPCCSYKAVAVTNIIQPSSAGEEASCFKQKTLVKQQDLRSTPANEDPCFSGRATETFMPEGLAATDFISSSCGSSSSLELGKCFNDLILNWNPSSLQSYDLNLATSCKACKPDHKVGLISTSSLQPQACYLPEFDIYQLPYVIPF